METKQTPHVANILSKTTTKIILDTAEATEN